MADQYGRYPPEGMAGRYPPEGAPMEDPQYSYPPGEDPPAMGGRQPPNYTPGGRPRAPTPGPSQYESQVPYEGGTRHPPSDLWTTGLFDCLEDFNSCCTTYMCPWIAFGRIAEIVDRGTTPCETSGALYFLISLVGSRAYTRYYRTKMRLLYNLPAEPCSDSMVNFCCEPCSICQEYRELRNRGFVMEAGWDGNVMMQTKGVTAIAPKFSAEMERY